MSKTRGSYNIMKSKNTFVLLFLSILLIFLRNIESASPIMYRSNNINTQFESTATFLFPDEYERLIFQGNTNSDSEKVTQALNENSEVEIDNRFILVVKRRKPINNVVYTNFG